MRRETRVPDEAVFIKFRAPGDGWSFLWNSCEGGLRDVGDGMKAWRSACIVQLQGLTSGDPMLVFPWEEVAHQTLPNTSRHRDVQALALPHEV